MLKTKQENKISLEKSITKQNRRILLFDLCVGGHHSSYIRHLINYWCKQESSDNLYILVSPKFIKEYPDIVDLVFSSPKENIQLLAITQEEESSLKSYKTFFERTLRAFQEWNLLDKYAKKLQITQSVILYFDTCQIPLVFGAQSPCPYSGIYFRPTFHYNDFANYSPSWKDKLQQWREKITLTRILSNRKLKTLFSLDPFAIQDINKLNKFNSDLQVLHLPDPVEIHNHSELNTDELREKLNIDANRKIFLLFGLLNSRKGIYQLLDAIKLLPSHLCKQLCLLVVGQPEPKDLVKIKQHVESLEASVAVQIIVNHNFISEDDMPKYFKLTDVVLAPYQKHVGMSGILLHAAAAQKPVLSSNYGLMGKLVRFHQLGITVDSTVANEIAKGLTKFLQESPQNFCDSSKMKMFATDNSSEKFAEKLFHNL